MEFPIRKILTEFLLNKFLKLREKKVLYEVLEIKQAKFISTPRSLIENLITFAPFTCINSSNGTES